jgi:hypothetical protein
LSLASLRRPFSVSVMVTRREVSGWPNPLVTNRAQLIIQIVDRYGLGALKVTFDEKALFLDLSSLGFVFSNLILAGLRNRAA